jgi:hypothetical protein
MFRAARRAPAASVCAAIAPEARDEKETMSTFPKDDWVRVHPAGLERADHWIAEVIGEAPYRLVVARGGAIVYERYSGLAAEERLGIASAAKSVYSTMLGIAIAGGVRAFSVRAG